VRASSALTYDNFIYVRAINNVDCSPLYIGYRTIIAKTTIANEMLRRQRNIINIRR